jgi:crossover junction endodeoxyribonuclease RusA
MTAPTDLGLLLAIQVNGKPRPKGSLRHVGAGRMVEQVDNVDWRSAVVAQAFEAIRNPDPDVDMAPGYLQTLAPGYPHTGPVKVIIELTFRPPQKPLPLPSTRTTGDVDKHARTILDALQDAGVIKDDAQVTDLRVSKRYGHVPGARITVWPAAVAPLVSTHLFKD